MRCAILAALACSCIGQSLVQFPPQAGKVPFNTAFPANQHMIMIGQTFCRQGLAQKRTKPALHPVADHGLADLSRHGNPKTDATPAIGAGQEHETRPHNAQAVVGGKKIGTTGKD